MSDTTETKKRRPRGEGALHWDESRQRWIAVMTVGYDGRGKRIVRKGSGKTETAALREMRKRVKEYEDGLSVEASRYTVEAAVQDWLSFGQGKASDETWTGYRFICERHLIPALGKRRLKDLTAPEVDKWLKDLTPSLGTSSLKQLHMCLNRSVKRALARGMAGRNVVELCDVPTGRKGRRSKSLTEEQVWAVLREAKGDPIYPYIVVSVLTGLRTEEVRALRWDHVDLDGDPMATPPVPPHVMVWRSERVGGDTKTEKSRRTLALPAVVVEALRLHRTRQAARDVKVGKRWDPDGLVFGTRNGTPMNARNVARDFRRALAKVAGINPAEWTPRELRHSFVSVMSKKSVPIEEVSRLVGHSGTAVTEMIYRHELRPVIQTGATAMDQIFPADEVGVGWIMEPLFGVAPNGAGGGAESA
ncbi:site-specific integrase [Antribacter gilvus]|uniref:site-specific integrase n=1 Tax=Antribacter gilvus TaxID=2304675 RepID=UPI000F78D682|nr:site-specific integrase [Antribacter gilvus]